MKQMSQNIQTNKTEMNKKPSCR